MTLIKNKPKIIPKSARFGFVRRFDVHCGVDIHCEEFTEVYALEDGVVQRVGPFTGEKTDTPWWNETDYIGILGSSGYIVYGEVEAVVKEGQSVLQGELIARVKRVLKKDKGVPTSMLHIELYSQVVNEPVEWKNGEEKPEKLLNVESILKDFTHLFEV